MSTITFIEHLTLIGLACLLGYVLWAQHQALWRWAKRRHPNKGRRWIMDKFSLE